MNTEVLARRRGRRAGVMWLAVGASLGSLLSSASVAFAGATMVGKPSPPSALSLPATPVLSGSSGTDLGYLPGSGGVTATGQYTYTIPIEVPAGRLGAQPNLSLTYSSGAGNGVLGVGWSLSGLSVIGRCGQNLSSEGVSVGVHYTDYFSTPDAQRDRFCLDGQKLVATSGGYGADGSVYRTENDQNLNIVSHATSAVAGGEGPDSYTVQSPDGSSRTYMPVEVSRSSGTSGGVASVGKVRALWVLSSQQDASGNGVVYNYNTDPSSTKCPAGELQTLLCSIDYTTFNGDASGAFREIDFTYESRTDQEFSWQAGVETQLLYRLTMITAMAPDPAAKAPVWEYEIGYQGSLSSFSGRSLLSTVQRCAIQGMDGKSPGSVGDCTWKKQFGYTTASSTPSFVASNVPGATNMEIARTLTSAGSSSTAPVQLSAAESGAPPMLSVADVNGDGASDVLVQPGATDTWKAKLATFAGSPCFGDNYGHSTGAPGCAAPFNFGPTLVLGSRGTQAATTSTASSPLATSYDLSTGYGGDFFNKNNELNTDVSAGGVHQVGGYPYYPNGWLENVSPVDSDGTGQTSLFVNDLNNGTCGRLLDWGPNNSFHLGVGFTDRGVDYGSCTPVTRQAQILNDVHYSSPGPSADFTGAGRGDMISTFTPSGGSPVLQPLINVGNNQTAAAPSSSVSGVSAACPFYIGDFTGDGRAQILGQLLDPVSGDCTKSGVLSYNPFSGAAPNSSFSMSWDSTGALPDLRQGFPVSFPNIVCLHEWNPANCVDKGGSDTAAGPPVTPLSLFFGDFNGDGLTDVVVADPVSKTLSLRWNTGNGFSAPVSLGSPGWMNGAYSIRVADLNHDGRDDLVVFHEVNSPGMTQRAITLMLFTGKEDGSFTSMDLTAMNASGPADPGLRTFEGWTGAVLGNFNGDGKVDIATLVGDPTQTVNGPDGQTYENHATLQTLMQPTFTASLPGSLLVNQPAADLLATVSDEGSPVNRVGVSYSSSTAPSGAPGWSDSPDSIQCPPTGHLSYPQHCITGGLVTVRSVTSADTTAETTANPHLSTHTVLYSYEEPTMDLRGRGFLGFRKVRVWDPTRLQQTITLYNNANETGTMLPSPSGTVLSGNDSFIPTLFGPGFYPNAASQPLSVTTITAIPSPSSPQTLPAFPSVPTANGGVQIKPGAVSVNARVDQSVFNTTLVQTNGGRTFVVQPSVGTTKPAVVHAQWEATVSMDALVTDAQDPSSDYMWGLGSYPLTPPSTGVVSDTTTVPATCDSTGNNPGSGTSGCIDSFGNVTATLQQAVTGGGLKGALVQTASTFNNLTGGSSWIIGQPASVTTTDTEPDTAETPVSRMSAFDYDSAGRLSHSYRCQQVSPAASGSGPCGSFALVSTTTMGYDQYGNTTSTATTALGPDGQQDTRQVNTEFDKVFTNEPDERIFPSQTWVPYDYPNTGRAPSTWQAIQPAFGVVVATEDVNGVQSQATFDDQGRPLTSSPAGAAETTFTYTGRTDPVLGGSDGMVVSATTGGVTSMVQSDMAGRTILTQQPAFDGTVTDTATVFDTLGRAVKTSRPYQDGTTPQFFGSQVLDGLDRVIKSTTPGGKTTKNSYTFFTAQQNDSAGVAHMVDQATTTDPVGNQSVVDTSVDGDVIASGNLVPDPAPATTSTWQLTTNHYQPFGLQDTATTPLGNKTTTSFDTLGRVTGSSSPDSGTMTNQVYDGFDELLSQTHQQSGAVTSYSYDPQLGRETGWRTTDNGVTTSSSYTYDIAPLGLGKLGTATSSDGVLTAYGYDNAGRQTAMTEVVGGNSYTINRGFDPQGRPSTLSYTLGSNPVPGVTLTYGYNTNQYLNSISYQNADQSAPGGVSAPQGLWKINARFPDGSLSSAGDPTTTQGVQVNYQQNPDSGQVKEITAVTGASIANKTFTDALDLNYAYNDDGQVQSRTDTVNARTDSYGYDSMNRLAWWESSTCATTGCVAVPGATGTTSNTTDYGYNLEGNITQTSTSATPGAPALIRQTYGYGPATGPTGNQGGPHSVDRVSQNRSASTYTYDTHGRLTGNSSGENITYNACNLPTTVTSNTQTWSLKYAADCQPASKTGPDGTTIYLGGIYQHRQTPANATLDVLQVPGVGQIETAGSNGTTTTKTLYTVTDTQQSTGITVDATTGQQQGGSALYDPFGASINTTPGPNPDVTNGFTGQENQEFGLLNYGGRYYDPNLKRFTTPDPLVSNPLNTQTHNPYSYADNNPVNNTDPTGYVTNSDCQAGDWGCDGNTNTSTGSTPADGTTLLGADGYWWKYEANSDSWGTYYLTSAACSNCADTVNVLTKPAANPPTFAGYETPADTPPAPGPTPADGDNLTTTTVQGQAGKPWSQRTIWDWLLGDKYKIVTNQPIEHTSVPAPTYDHSGELRQAEANAAYAKAYATEVAKAAAIQLALSVAPTPALPPCEECIYLYSGGKSVAQTAEAAQAAESIAATGANAAAANPLSSTSIAPQYAKRWDGWQPSESVENAAREARDLYDRLQGTNPASEDYTAMMDLYRNERAAYNALQDATTDEEFEAARLDRLNAEYIRDAFMGGNRYAPPSFPYGR